MSFKLNINFLLTTVMALSLGIAGSESASSNVSARPIVCPKSPAIFSALPDASSHVTIDGVKYLFQADTANKDNFDRLGAEALVREYGFALIDFNANADDDVKNRCYYLAGAFNDNTGEVKIKHLVVLADEDAPPIHENFLGILLPALVKPENNPPVRGKEVVLTEKQKGLLKLANKVVSETNETHDPTMANDVYEKNSLPVEDLMGISLDDYKTVVIAKEMAKAAHEHFESLK